MRGQRHPADDPVSSSQQLRCGVVYTDTTHGAQGTRWQQPPTAAGSFWDSRNARKYHIGTFDHMRHWPSLPLGRVRRVSRPYTGLPDHAYALVARGEIKRNHPRGYTKRNSQTHSSPWDFLQVIPRMVCNPAGASRPTLPICNQSTYIHTYDPISVAVGGEKNIQHSTED